MDGKRNFHKKRIQSTLDISNTRYLELCPISNKTLGPFSINSSGVTTYYLELSIFRTFFPVPSGSSRYRESTVILKVFMGFKKNSYLQNE